jgi:hypothetical protein
MPDWIPCQKVYETNKTPWSLEAICDTAAVTGMDVLALASCLRGIWSSPCSRWSPWLLSWSKLISLHKHPRILLGWYVQCHLSQRKNTASGTSAVMRQEWKGGGCLCRMHSPGVMGIGSIWRESREHFALCMGTSNLYQAFRTFIGCQRKVTMDEIDWILSKFDSLPQGFQLGIEIWFEFGTEETSLPHIDSARWCPF